MDEGALLEKLAGIEALHSGATTAGERTATADAGRRVQLRIASIAKLDPPVEYRFTLADDWSRKLFIALLRRYEVEPYRYHGQQRTTVMARLSPSFVDETLWPEYTQLSEALRLHLESITERVVDEVLHADASDVVERPHPPLLGARLAHG
jgi:hypothetical protein